jgi:hypothetical protein
MNRQAVTLIGQFHSILFFKYINEKYIGIKFFLEKELPETEVLAQESTDPDL